MAMPKTAMSDGQDAITLPSADGKKLVEYKTHMPTPEQLAVFGIESATPIAEGDVGALMAKVAALFNFLGDILEDQNDLGIIKARLRDTSDVLDLNAFLQSIENYISDQSGFPTQEPSGSSPSRSTTGKRSTGRIQPGE